MSSLNLIRYYDPKTGKKKDLRILEDIAENWERLVKNIPVFTTEGGQIITSISRKRMHRVKLLNYYRDQVSMIELIKKLNTQ